MDCNILVLNLGSTSFKFKYFDMDKNLIKATGKIENIYSKYSKFEFCANDNKKEGTFDTQDGYVNCINYILNFLKENNIKDISAIAFKTVMAGDINYPCVIDDNVVSKMKKYNFAFPAHNEPYLAAIEAVKKIDKNITMIASFETGFHNTIPDYAYTYPIDKSLADKHGIRKYGFHGAAHSFAAWKYKTKEPDAKKIVSIHLGGSSSICAINDGKSVDTSMGFSPQSGLPMNNRTGDIDVFAILSLMNDNNISPMEMREILCKKSGLLGISQISNDMRDIEKSDDKNANLAIDVFVYSIIKYIGSYFAVLNGIDLISFSGGIGENSSVIKEKVIEAIKFLGVELKEGFDKIPLGKEPIKISTENSKIKVYITPVDEEFMVAKNAEKVLGRS